MNNLEYLANILQIVSYLILTSDFNNNDLMKFLNHQDMLIDKIIKQNDEIIKLLKGENPDAQKIHRQDN